MSETIFNKNPAKSADLGEETLMNVYYGDELERYKAIADITTDRLSEICAAERDGRLVVLPCKVGDTLYYPYAKRVIEKRVTQYRELLRKSECIDKWLCVDFSNDETFEADDIGKTIFLTRAEAEAALQKEAQHE